MSKGSKEYFNRKVGISSGKGSRPKKGKGKYTGSQSISSAGTLPDVLPPAPFPHLKGKP